MIPKDYQLDTVKDFPLHIDFLRVSATSRLNVQVTVHFINEEQSPGLKRGGTINVVHYTVELSCPPDSIPESITADLTGLDIGDAIHVSSIILPPGVELHTHEADMTIATIVAPSALRSEEETAPAAAPAAAPEAPKA